MKTIKINNSRGKVIAFNKWIATYGTLNKGKYRIEVNYTLNIVQGTVFKIWNSKKKPMFRNLGLISILLYPFIAFSLPIQFTLYLLLIYLEGAKNYFKDGAWVTNVRLFNNVNIALIIILALLLVAF